ncbi:adenylyl-sulfate kinase [Mucilaginibacter panaciglaebae]|uniref:Adenylyl-sulfate kinase n=1 Tax=Mucilaginibacter panaciglaebae TaxID=502331 RepID=A0ABP7X343_9SPHI
MDKRKKNIFQFTGLSGSGKTTLAFEVAKLLQERDYTVQVLDGDEMRKSISAGLGFSREDRLENMKRIACYARESLADVVLVAVINPYAEGRRYMRNNCEAPLVWIRCGVDILKQRDTKGLYKEALLPDGHPAKLGNLSGINDPFEEPQDADFVVDTDKDSIARSAFNLCAYISGKLCAAE